MQSPVSALDVLLVVNELNVADDDSDSGPWLAWDTNQDGRVTPLDALLVINYLNVAGGVGGEGEAGRRGVPDGCFPDSHDVPIGSAVAAEIPPSWLDAPDFPPAALASVAAGRRPLPAPESRELELLDAAFAMW